MDTLEHEVRAREAWTDAELLADINGHFQGLHLRGTTDFYDALMPSLRLLLCTRKKIFESAEADLVLAVAAVLLEVYTIHLAGSLAVYVCRKGIRNLCAEPSQVQG